MTLPLLTRKPYRDPPGQVLAGDLRLPLARVHEFCGPARRTLALIAARGMQGPVFWIASHWQGDTLLGDGVQGYIDPGRITFVRPKRAEDILWATEECLRAGCFDASTRLDSIEMYSRLSNPRTACRKQSTRRLPRFSIVSRSLMVGVLVAPGLCGPAEM